MSTSSTLSNNSRQSSRRTEDISKLENDFEVAADVNSKVLDHLCDIEADLDGEDYYEEIEYSGRRKKWVTREFDFKGANDSDCDEDLVEIFGDRGTSKITCNSKSFKKNDVVVCVLEKKKYKGIVFQVNNEGLVIKTKDRKKIKIPWDSVEENKVTLSKSRSLVE